MQPDAAHIAKGKRKPRSTVAPQQWSEAQEEPSSEAFAGYRPAKSSWLPSGASATTREPILRNQIQPVNRASFAGAGP